jgi:hypothetical protein
VLQRRQRRARVFLTEGNAPAWRDHAA